MKRLYGKVAIVTGGATGIGEAISKKFALEGASVVVAGLPDDPVQNVVKEIEKAGGKAAPFAGDISSWNVAKSCVGFAVQQFGKLDILINNAGVYPEMNFLTDFTEEAFDYLFKNNNRTTFMMSKAALPELQKTHGNIVTTGSEAGELGQPQNAPYGGTKAFNIAFTKGLAAEQAQYGVRCNIVGPGPIDTAWTHKETGPMDKKTEKLQSEATLMGRRGTVEEVANVFLFLASDEASFVTGALYMVDGGITIAKGPTGDQANSHFKKEPKGDLELEHTMEGHTSIRNNYA